MGRRLIWPAVVALSLGCGLGEWKLARERDVHRCYNTVPVVVAAHRIDRGTAIRIEDLEQRSLPEQFVRQNDVRSDQARAVVDLPALRTLEEGEPIGWFDVALTAAER